MRVAVVTMMLSYPLTASCLFCDHERDWHSLIGLWRILCIITVVSTVARKDALQRTGCESVEATVRTRKRLLWLGTLLLAWTTTGYPRGSCRERWRTRKNVSRRGRGNNGRTAWRRMIGCLASGGMEFCRTRPWGLVAHYRKEAAGLWSSCR